MKQTRPPLRLDMVAAAIAIVAVLTLAVVQAHAQAFTQSPEWAGTDFSKRSVDLSEIASGGPAKDGIPAIDDPAFVAIAEARDLAPDEPVVSLALDGDARAYPLRVMIWHEIVNDTVGGIPVAVTYCPLCNSAVVFRRTVNGKLLDFGTTGKLRKSDLVMYDRQTQSWWQQFTGMAIVGELTGMRLKPVPARLESFKLFQERHPQGRVLVPNDPALRNYGYNPYFEYDNRAGPFEFFKGDLPRDIYPMERVVAVTANGKPRAVTMNHVRENGPVKLGDLVISWVEGQRSALDTARIDEGREVGNIVVQRQTADGLEDAVYDVTFAFVFFAFHPDSKIIQD